MLWNFWKMGQLVKGGWTRPYSYLRGRLRNPLYRATTWRYYLNSLMSAWLVIPLLFSLRPRPQLLFSVVAWGVWCGVAGGGGLYTIARSRAASWHSGNWMPSSAIKTIILVVWSANVDPLCVVCMITVGLFIFWCREHSRKGWVYFCEFVWSRGKY